MSALNIVQITPFMHVPSLDAALKWFSLLGFGTAFHQGNYAYVTRDGAGVRVLESAQDDCTPFPPHRGFAYYVDVRDVQALFDEIAPRLHASSVEFMGPKDQTYGQREFMIRAPDGNVFVFGQALPQGEKDG